jgi:hypothetical protein
MLVVVSGSWLTHIRFLLSPGASKPASNGRFKTSQFHVNVVD